MENFLAVLMLPSHGRGIAQCSHQRYGSVREFRSCLFVFLTVVCQRGGAGDINLFKLVHVGTTPLSNLFTWERGRLAFDRKAFLVKIVKVSVSLHSVPSV